MSLIGKRLFLLIVFFLATILCLWSWAAEKGWKTIQPQALQQMMAATDKPVLVNAMSHIECLDHSIPGSLCIASEEFEKNISQLPAAKDKTLVFYCEDGTSQKNCEGADAAVRHGYTNVFVLEGGIPAWKKAGYEVQAVERIHRLAVPSVKPPILKRWLSEKRNLVLLDIRPDKLFSQAHIEGAVNIPLYELHRRYEELPLNRLLVIIDSTGTQTLLAASYLKRKGFGVCRLFGGMAKWESMLLKEKKSPVKD